MNFGVNDSDINIFETDLVLWLDAAQKRSYSGSGTTWTDLSGNGNNGTLTNGPTFNSANGGSIVFDGSNDYIDLGTTNFSITRDFTISFWMNMSTKTGDVDIFNKGYNSPYGIYIAKTSDNKLTLQGSLTSGFFQLDTVTTSYTGIKNWVGVRDNTNLYWYVNGSQDTTSSGNSANNVSQDAAKNWWLGANSELTSGYFLGNIYSMLIYNTPLSATQVSQNYNAEKSRFGL